MLNDNGLVITGVNCITPMGESAEMTAASVKAGIGRLVFSDCFSDSRQNAVKMALIDGFPENEPSAHQLFVHDIARKCLCEFLKETFQEDFVPETVYLFLGLPSEQRPGIRFDASQLAKETESFCGDVTIEKFTAGNPSAIHALEKASDIIKDNPEALCIIGAMDSLLTEETIAWFEKDQRLNSQRSARANGVSPSQAVTFFSVESKKAALNDKRPLVAEITGIGTAGETSSFVSGLASKGEGLTNAIGGALEKGAVKPESIDHVLCDMNGEFHRSKEWGFAGVRCLGHGNYHLWHPADCMGDMGAASAGVLLAVAVEGLNNRWLDERALVFTSDDHGDCGAVVISKIKGDD